MTHGAPIPSNKANGWKLTFSLALAIMVLHVQASSGRPPGHGATDIPVTTTISDIDAAGNLYTISSDGGGSYSSSVLAANAYNGLTNGDWQFNKVVINTKTRPGSRKLRVSLNVADAVQPGDPHYTAPANPPFWGAEILYGFSQVECTYAGKSMLTMTANTAMTCGQLIEFYTTDGVQYGVSPAHSFNNFPETTDVQVTCNAVDSVGCKDWFIDPIGSTQAVGRLATGGVDEGDFYMRFHIHITRP